MSLNAVLRNIRKWVLYRTPRPLQLAFMGLYKACLWASIFSKHKEKLEIVVCHEKKCIIILNPKVASRSIIDFAECHFEVEIQEHCIENVFRRFPAGDWRYFAFFRSPVERALSVYRQKIRSNEVLIRYGLLSQFKSLKDVTDFDQFCCWLNTSEGSDQFADRHWRSQVNLLFGEDLRFLKNYVQVFLIEDLVAGLMKIFSINSECQSSFVVPHLLKTSGHNNELWVSRQSIRLLKCRYSVDFEVFSKLKQGDGIQALDSICRD